MSDNRLRRCPSSSYGCRFHQYNGQTWAKLILDVDNLTLEYSVHMRWQPTNKFIPISVRYTKTAVNMAVYLYFYLYRIVERISNSLYGTGSG